MWGRIFLLLRSFAQNPEVVAVLSITIINLIKKKMNEEKIKNAQPLHLPKGSIRAVFTLICLLVVIGSFILKYQVPTEFYALTIFAVGYYVGYRTDNTQLKEIKK